MRQAELYFTSRNLVGEVQFLDSVRRTKIGANQLGTQLSIFLTSIGSLPKGGSDFTRACLAAFF